MAAMAPAPSLGAVCGDGGGALALEPPSPTSVFEADDVGQAGGFFQDGDPLVSVDTGAGEPDLVEVPIPSKERRIRGNTESTTDLGDCADFVDPVSPDPGSPAVSKATFWSGAHELFPVMGPLEQQSRKGDPDPSVVATSCAEKFESCAAAMVREASEPIHYCAATLISDVTPRGSSCHPHARLESPQLPTAQLQQLSRRGIPEQSACSLSTAASWHGGPPHLLALPPPPGSSIGASSCSQALGVGAEWQCLQMDDGDARDASAVGSPLISPRPKLHSVNFAPEEGSVLDQCSEATCEDRGPASLVDHASMAPDITYPLVVSVVGGVASAKGPIAEAGYNSNQEAPFHDEFAHAVDSDAWELHRSCGHHGGLKTLHEEIHPVGQFNGSACDSIESEGAPSHVDSDGVHPCEPTHASQNMSVISPTWFADDVRFVPGHPVTQSEQDELTANRPPRIYLDGVLVYTAVPPHRYPVDDATRISGPSQSQGEHPPSQQSGARPPMPTPADSSFGTPNDHATIHVVDIEATRAFARADHTEIASTVATGGDRQSDAASTVATDAPLQAPIGLFTLEGGFAGTTEHSGSAISAMPEVGVGDLQASISAALAL